MYYFLISCFKKSRGNIKRYKRLLNNKKGNSGSIYQKLFGHKSSKIISIGSKTKYLKVVLSASLNTKNLRRQCD